MPQMAPMNWLILFIMFIIIFIMINVLNYFNIFFIKPSNKTFMTNYTQKFNWKW